MRGRFGRQDSAHRRRLERGVVAQGRVVGRECGRELVLLLLLVLVQACGTWEDNTIAQRGNRERRALQPDKLWLVQMDFAIVRPGLDTALVVAREADPSGASEIDEIAQEPLVLAGQQDFDVQGRGLGLGLDGEGAKEVCAVDLQIETEVHGAANDLGGGQLVVCVEEVDLTVDAAAFCVGEEAGDTVFAGDAAGGVAYDRG